MGYGCNADATISSTQAGGEIWRIYNVLAPSFSADTSSAAGNPSASGGNMSKVQLCDKTSNAAFVPVTPRLCRYGKFPTPIAALPAEAVLFAAQNATGNGWSIWALDVNVDTSTSTTGNVQLVADLSSLSPKAPAGMFFEVKNAVIFLTLDNMVVKASAGEACSAWRVALLTPEPLFTHLSTRCITRSLQVDPTTKTATAIANVANVAADPMANSATLDNSDAKLARFNQPQGVAGRLYVDPCGTAGCLLIADHGNHRIRLLDLTDGGHGVMTAVGDGNVSCSPAPGATSSSTTSQSLPPCSVDGTVPIATHDFETLGGWAAWPGIHSQLPGPLASVDSPMQIILDTANDQTATDRPPFHLWLTERTGTGTFMRSVDQDGFIKTLGNPSDIPPQAPRNIRSASLGGGVMLVVMEDGTLVRAQVTINQNQSGQNYSQGYDPNAPYAQAAPAGRRLRSLGL